MYESHFGLTGPPFQLNPDPAFYFASRGHGSALSYLKFGAHQGEGFIVVTGEIGAGKTTLVKTLLAGLDPTRLVAAQVVTTQLEAGDLLRTILTAFGVAPTGSTKAHLIATLEGFLTAVAAKGRRALLIVDEAQNLDRTAVEELRMLSNFQLGNQGLLQSFLVGQPELRVLLQSKSMEQLRQRVIASCHLGPLDRLETRAYIEHRLHHVGWTQNPRFDVGAHERIHDWTGGIPRRINRLCNRLMLAAFLEDRDAITEESVEQTALALGAEIGEPASLEAPVARRGGGAGHGPGAVRGPEQVVQVRVPPGAAGKPAEPLICLVDDISDYLEAGALDHAFAHRPALPSVVALHVGTNAEMDEADASRGAMASPALDIRLNVEKGLGAHDAAQALIRFDAILDEYSPSAVMAIGSSNAVLACALLAQKRGVALLRSNAGRSRSWSPPSEISNAALLDLLSDVLYTESPATATQLALHRVGVAAERVQCVGDLAANVAHAAQTDVAGPAASRARQAISHLHTDRTTGLALVTKRFRSGSAAPEQMRETMAVLAAARTEIPLLWVVNAETLHALESSGSVAQLEAAGIRINSNLGYLDCLALLGQARFVIAGPEACLVDEARALALPSIVIDGDDVYPVGTSDAPSSPLAASAHQLTTLIRQLVGSGPGSNRGPDWWDGGPAARVAAHLEPWLRRRIRSKAHLRLLHAGSMS